MQYRNYISDDRLALGFFWGETLAFALVAAMALVVF